MTKKPVKEQAVKDTFTPVFPITEEEVHNQIQELITEWATQNSDRAIVDLQLGSYRILVRS